MLSQRKNLLVAGLFIVALVMPLMVFVLQKQTELQTRAWSTSQSAVTQCSTGGNAQIFVTFRNTEPSRSMNVIAVDQASGKSVNLGTVGPSVTKTGTIVTDKSSITGSNVLFNLAWTDAPNTKDLRSASYGAITCTAPTPVVSLPPVNACTDDSMDIMLVIDQSPSMRDDNKFAKAKSAAKIFIDTIEATKKLVGSPNQSVRIGLISFGYKATLQNNLTTDYAAVKSSIDRLDYVSATCIQCAILKTNEVFNANPGSRKKAVVFLTDGRANWIISNTKPLITSNETPAAIAEQSALDALKLTPENTQYFTIGLGRDVNSAFLDAIAVAQGGRSYASPDTNQLEQIYQQISRVIGQGSVSGFVFNDLNKNGAFDTGEPKLPGWTIELYAKNANEPQSTAVTDSNGAYSFTGVCGDYQVKQVAQSGWSQTVPTNPDGYFITINDNNVHDDKIFGNASSTAAAGTKLALEVFLHNIGNSGDNANPAHSLSNKNPLRPVRNAIISLYDQNDSVVATTSGDIVYANDSGSFKGIFDLGSSLLSSGSGAYRVRVKTPEHLVKLLPGIHTITANQTNTLAVAHYVATDNNNDNKLNILDYNMLLDCYSDTIPAPACNAQKKLDTDPNDDGNVNQFDYNLFVREISVQAGD